MSWLEGLRKRPGMYIGSTGPDGCANLVLELVANAYDQYLAGRCSEISVTLERDGTFVVSDNGPGISGDVHRMVTEPSNQPTVDGHRPHVHLWGGGSGLAVVSGLSERFEISTVRDGIETRGVYARGEVVEPLVSTPSTKVGTVVRATPDSTLLGPMHLPRVRIATLLDELAFLSPGLRIAYRDDGFVSSGLAQRVALIAGCAVDLVVHAKETVGDVDIETAFTTRDGFEPHIDSFVNYVRSPKHGTHVDGLLDVVPEAGLVAAVAIVTADVKWGGPVKHRVVSPELRPLVADVVRRALASRR